MPFLKKISIYEPNGLGHRFWFTRIVAEEARAYGHDVQLMTFYNALQTDEYSVHLQDLKLRLHRLRGDPDTTRMREVLRQARAIRLQTKTGRVVVLDGDRIVLGLALTAARLPRGSLSILCLRLPQNGIRGFFKRLSMRVVSRSQYVFVLGDCLGQSDRDAVGFKIIADPVDRFDRATDSSPHMESSRPFNLLAAGVIDRRKGIDVLLKVVAKRSDVRLRLVGRQSEEVREILENMDPPSLANIEITDAYVSEIDLQRQLRAADAVSCVLRTSHGSSGLLGKSLRAGKPVLSAGNQTVGNLVDNTGVGVFVKSLGIEEIDAGLSRLMAHYSDYAKMATAVGGRLTTPSEFARTILSMDSHK